MVPYFQTITVWRGDTYTQMMRLRSRVWNPLLNNGLGNWAPGPYRNLTGWSGAFDIRTQPDAVSPAGVGTVSFMDQTNPNTVGGLVFTMPSTVTQALVPDPNYVPPFHAPWIGGGWMYYDMKLTDPSGNVRTFLAGLVKFLKNATY